MAGTKQILLFLLPFLKFLVSFASPSLTYNVLNYGAKGVPSFDSTQAFLAAWTQACGSLKPAIIYVPAGRFTVRHMAFRGPCKNNAVVLRMDGTLVAPVDYKVIGNAGQWILFEEVNGISISGGLLDGQGTNLWTCKKSGRGCPNGAKNLVFRNSKNIMINGLKSLNSQQFHIVFDECNNAKVQGVRVMAPGDSPNTDGIHIERSSGITVLNSNIGTGDDCISIGPGSTNLWIENIACGPGHGISIGSLGWELQEAGVENVTVKTVTFSGTQNGVRIKSWARPSNGFAKNILFQHATMTNVDNPIVIDQNYCPDHKNCPNKASGVKINDVMYEDIYGTSTTKIAVKFDCSSTTPCTGIKMDGVKLTYKSQAAEASCSNADGSASGVVQPTSCL